MNIGQASPYVEAFAIARAAAAAIFAVIDRVPEIDSFSEEGAVPKGSKAPDDPENDIAIPEDEKMSNNNNNNQDVKDDGNNNDGDNHDKRSKARGTFEVRSLKKTPHLYWFLQIVM